MTIDLKRIFKYMPTGIRLYSPLFGDCTLERVDSEDNIIVSFVDKKGQKRYPVFDGNFGFLQDCNNGKLMIFPDKNETWDGWQKKLFKKGDFISFGIDGETLVFINDDSFLTCHGKWVRNRNLNGYFYSSDKQIHEFKSSLRTEGYKWNGSTFTLEPIVEKPVFKIGEMVVYKGKTDFENEPLKICDIKDNKYIFDDNSFAYIYTQNQFAFAGYFPIFKVGELIKKKGTNLHSIIESITDRCYTFKNDPNEILIFEFQNDWESVYGEGESYCSYENCKSLIDNGFRYKGELCDNLETYGFYSGQKHDVVVFDDYMINDEDCIRISQNSAMKWIRKIYGIEVGAKPVMDCDANETVYIPFAKRYSPYKQEFINEISYLEAIASENYEDAVDEAIKFVFKRLV